MLSSEKQFVIEVRRADAAGRRLGTVRQEDANQGNANGEMVSHFHLTGSPESDAGHPLGAPANIARAER